LELEFRLSEKAEDGARFAAVITPALGGSLFHADGQWDADLALRNLYLQAERLFKLPITLWAGSRMYRGNQIYLLDFWPLDDINTVGGGAVLGGAELRLSLHAGLSRPEEGEYQLQEVQQVQPGELEPETVQVLDRQRQVLSLKGERRLALEQGSLGLALYGEGWHLPAGQRIEEGMFHEELPADGGAVAGAEVFLEDDEGSSSAHIWYRYATGLGVYGELDVPQDGLALDGSTQGAREHRIAVGGWWMGGPGELLWGGYARHLRDADADHDIDDRWEAHLALRPVLSTGAHSALAVELSHQLLRPEGINPRSREHDVPQISRISALPTLRLGPALSQPQLRFQYTYAHLNDDARMWFPEGDVRQTRNHQHYIGLGAEWWQHAWPGGSR
jgi:maltoporin